MANKWLKFLKEFRGRHKGISLRDAMKPASNEYKKGGAAEKVPAKKRVRRKKKT